MEGIKGFFQSKTIWGALISLAGIAPSILPLFGLSITGDDASSIVTALQSITVAVGNLMAIYGRVVATQKIG